MKIFKSLAVLAGLDAACPNSNQWTDDAGTCRPLGMTTTCQNDGKLTINAHINHFYEDVPSAIRDDLFNALKDSDSWAEVTGQADMLTQEVDMTFSQVDVNGVSYIRGEYVFGPSGTASAAAMKTVSGQTLKLATALSYTVTCDYASTIDVTPGEVGVDASATFGGTSTTGDLDITATLTGASQSGKWMLGDSVGLSVSDNTAISSSLKIAIESCTAYSDSAYTSSPVAISIGVCGEAGVNAAIVTRAGNFVSAISFDAFKYSNADETAYVKCSLRVCYVNGDGVTDAACASAVTADARGGNDGVPQTFTCAAVL